MMKVLLPRNRNLEFQVSQVKNTNALDKQSLQEPTSRMATRKIPEVALEEQLQLEIVIRES